MRIPKTWVPLIAKKIVDNLTAKEMIQTSLSDERLVEEIQNILMYELMAEDRVNEEVRQFLRQYESEIEKGKLDYRKMFEITKKKIVREKNIIL
ncbi:MAG: DUF507 family protein [Dissulfurispiraceae bacterium]|jgi:hypothetical protein|nr:DUF507 family protein [Dissulfurispiraceae bacterium]